MVQNRINIKLDSTPFQKFFRVWILEIFLRYWITSKSQIVAMTLKQCMIGVENIFHFSAVVWMGDMNFRIRDFTREEVISKVQGKCFQNFISIEKAEF